MPLTFRTPVTQPFHEFGWPRPSSGPDSDDFRITSPFGWRNDPLNPGHQVFHGGLDIGNGHLNYPLVAVADATVIAAGFLLQPWSTPAPNGVPWVGGNYGGLMVILDHGHNVISLYAHMSGILVAAGNVVTSGQRIGYVGDTGSAYHAGHLHYGLQVGGAWIDPEPYVRLGKPLPGDDMLYFIPPPI